MHALLRDGLDKVLCRIVESLVFATLYELSIFWGKESYINAKEV